MSGASNISCSCSISSMMRSTSMGLNHLVESGSRSIGSHILLFSEFQSSSVNVPGPATHPLLLPTGAEYHVGMSRVCPQCLGANSSYRLAQDDVLLREEPNEEEDEEEEEDDRKEDDEDEGTDDGYSE